MRAIILFMGLLSAANRAYSQYDFIIKQIISPKSTLEIHRIKGAFTESGRIKGIYNRYFFKSGSVKIAYKEALSNEECDEVNVMGENISMKGKFYNDQLACNLDVNSFEVYQFSFQSRHYLILKGIKKGSGESTSNIIFNVFDITNEEKIFYYPLSSVYGSILCFADFNKDNKLDFLNIGYAGKGGNTNTYRAHVLTLNSIDGRFVELNDNKSILFKREYLDDGKLTIKVLHKVWYK